MILSLAFRREDKIRLTALPKLAISAQLKCKMMGSELEQSLCMLLLKYRGTALVPVTVDCGESDYLRHWPAQ